MAQVIQTWLSSWSLYYFRTKKEERTVPRKTKWQLGVTTLPYQVSFARAFSVVQFLLKR